MYSKYYSQYDVNSPYVIMQSVLIDSYSISAHVDVGQKNYDSPFS